VPYFFTIISLLIVSRKKNKQIPVFDFIAVIVASIYVIWAILGVGGEVIFYSMILFVVSVVFYFFSRKSI
jgi:hypothetical protein